MLYTNFTNIEIFYNLEKAQRGGPTPGRWGVGIQAFWQGAGEKLKLCGILGANCVGKNVDCAGNGVGLHNLMTNQIFNLQCSSQTWQGGNSP